MQLIPALRLEADTRRPEVLSIVGGGGKTSLLFRLASEVVATGARVVTTTTTRVTLHQLQMAPATVRMTGETIPWDDLQRALDAHHHVMLAGSETLLDGKQRGVAPGVVDRIAERAHHLGVAAIVVEGDGSRTLPVKAPAEHEPVVAESTTHLLPVLGLEAIGAPIDETHTHRPALIREVLGLADHVARLTPAMGARLLLHSSGGAKSLPANARLVPILNKADGTTQRTCGRIVASRLAEAASPALLCAAGNPQSDPVIERWGPLCVVVLAAGGSSRFGRPKQLALVQGETLVHRATRLALESAAQRVVVVTGAATEEVEAALSDLQAAAGERLLIRRNPQWDEGQSGSLRVGMQALDDHTDAVLFLPIDQPFLDGALLARLIQAWRLGAQMAAPSVEGEVRGSPALFDKVRFADLHDVSGDRGGRDVLSRHAESIRGVPAPARWLVDVDTPSALDAQGT